MPREPIDEGALLNAAFVAALVSSAAKSHEQATGNPLAWPLVFVVPPLVVFSDVRERLPKRVTAHLAKWVTANPLIRLENGHRTAAMTTYTMRAIRFGARHGLLELTEGRLRGTVTDSAAANAFAGEAAEILRAASFVGKLLARDDASQVYALLGVRP